MHARESMTPEAAVARAFWTVKIPSMALMFLPWAAFIIGAHLRYVPSVGPAGFKWFLPAFLFGLVAGWLVWSIQVPRWRLWAYQRVDDVAELKRHAIAAQLIWPDGHFLARTEIAGSQVREQIRILEASKSRRRARADQRGD